MSWIMIDTDLPDKPEVDAMMRFLGLDRSRVFMLVFEWFRFVDSAMADESVPLDMDQLRDRFAARGCRDFPDALLHAGWLARRPDGGLAVPGFEERFGKNAKRRAQTARRVFFHRAKKTEGECGGDDGCF